MSGKYVNRKKKNKKSKGLWVAVAVLLLLLLGIMAAFLMNAKENPADEGESTLTAPGAESTAPTVDTAKMRIPVGNGLEILDIAGYTGIFMEDGSDELVSGVLMMKLTNSSKEAVEYAKITLTVNGDPAQFTLTALKPGDTVVLLEQNRKSYDKSLDYTAAEITCENLALFQQEPSLHEDKISIQIMDGAINVSNITEEDIQGRIAIYYKNKASGIYYGGITYRIILEDGLKAGEIRQMMASHFSDTGSEIVFVTIAE